MNLQNIESSYSSQSEWQEENEKFNQFKTDPRLIKLLNETNGPYPAGHGKDHVNNVIKIIDSLFNQKCKDKLTIIDVFNLLVAVCIHDVAMIHMIPTGASGEPADDARSMHSYEKYLEKIIDDYNILDPYDNRKEFILKLASAHANDKEHTVEDKLLEYGQHLERISLDLKKRWEILVRLICISDYLDLGENRLRHIAGSLRWDTVQKQHYDKHRYLSSPKISNSLIIVGLTVKAEDIVKNKDGDLKERLEILTIVQKVYYELEKHVKNLNESLTADLWTLRPLDEGFFGKLFPLSYGIQLYTTIFEKALSELKENIVFNIDMLGHSLYARIVKNEEKLNERLFDILKRKGTHLRILLLDPETELQQSCEIYDSQKQKEEDRSILPSYDKNQNVIENGDILYSLGKIKSEWQEKVGEDSSLKVKLTKKILYASMMRFEGQMIVTPYTMGLSSQSISIVYSKESPIFDAFIKDFELLWNKKDETRLYLNKTGVRVVENNPIKDIITNTNLYQNQSNFNYENWLLNEDRKDRIRFWFENEGKIIPPYELEIQPTNTCNLKCMHCIGRHMDYLDLKKRTLEKSHLDNIKSLLDWKQDEFKIERLRISGLNGDPLSDDALEFTKELIERNDSEYGRKIVLFTNGININKAIDNLLKIDTLHISIDAGTSDTFHKLKNNGNPKVIDYFQKILDNIDELKAKRKFPSKKPEIGIGFVVTQSNYFEVEDILNKANELGVDFIRFKRDIHLPNSISWRTWVETKNNIEKIIENKTKKSKDKYPKIENIFITDLPRQHWNGNTKDCISYKFCLTIGADGKIYTCDHLTSKPYSAIAELSDKNLINTIIENINNKEYCNKLKNCSQCPPFNFRFNYFIPQLRNLYVDKGWNDLNNKINNYIQNIINEP